MSIHVHAYVCASCVWLCLRETHGESEDRLGKERGVITSPDETRQCIVRSTSSCHPHLAQTWTPLALEWCYKSDTSLGYWDQEGSLKDIHLAYRDEACRPTIVTPCSSLLHLTPRTATAYCQCWPHYYINQGMSMVNVVVLWSKTPQHTLQMMRDKDHNNEHASNLWCCNMAIVITMTMHLQE